MVRKVIESPFGEMPDDAFLHARQENLETIHRHNVVAERYGLLGELKRELTTGEHSRRHTTTREWLEAPGAPGP
jgi:GTP cyclohydrolase I/GTP cyclohydrolase-4